MTKLAHQESSVLLSLSAVGQFSNTKNIVINYSRFRPDFHHSVVKFFVDQLPYEVGKRLVPVERTPLFIVIGTFLHFLTWFLILLSTSDLSSRIASTYVA